MPFGVWPQGSWVLFGGAEETRTPDPLRAREVLSQLSYGPFFVLRPRALVRLRLSLFSSRYWFARWPTKVSSPSYSRLALVLVSTRCRSVVGHGGLEPPTSVLSGPRSNQLS